MDGFFHSSPYTAISGRSNELSKTIFSKEYSTHYIMGGHANNKHIVTQESANHQDKELDIKLQTCAIAAVTVSKMVVVV